jgi:hypothetical protein
MLQQTVPQTRLFGQQLPPTQLWLLVQTLPPAPTQPPQFLGSVAVLVQVPLQQDWVLLQTLPPAPAQPPQLLESLAVFTHAPPQQVDAEPPEQQVTVPRPAEEAPHMIPPPAWQSSQLCTQVLNAALPAANRARQ